MKKLIIQAGSERNACHYIKAPAIIGLNKNEELGRVQNVQPVRTLKKLPWQCLISYAGQFNSIGDNIMLYYFFKVWLYS